MTNKESAFEPVFEEKLIQTILVDHVFGEQIFEVLEPDYFGENHTRAFAKTLKNYYSTYESFPSNELLPSIIEKEEKDPVINKRCRAYLKKIQETPLNGDLEYVKEKSLEFFKLQDLLNTFQTQVFPRIEAGAGKLEEIVPIIEKSINRGTDNDIGYEYHEDEEDRFNEETKKVIPTIWKDVNKILKGGGFEEKRLITFIAPPGAGKSSCLVNVGKGALLQGKTVVHYTFELDKYEIAEKYDASITNFSIDEIVGNKELVLLSLREKLPENAKLIIKEYPVRGASIQTIKAHLSKLKLKDIVPDLIIIDQGGNLKSSQKNKEERFNLSDNWLDMKNLAQTYEVPVITAHQVNRTGYREDVIYPDQIAGCFDILGTTDVLITMARNIEQKNSGMGKMLWAKSRQGKDGIILGYAFNGSTAQVDIFEMTPEMEEIFEEEKMKTEDNQSVDLARKLGRYLDAKSRKE